MRVRIRVGLGEQQERPTSVPRLKTPTHDRNRAAIAATGKDQDQTAKTPARGPTNSHEEGDPLTANQTPLPPSPRLSQASSTHPPNPPHPHLLARPTLLFLPSSPQSPEGKTCPSYIFESKTLYLVHIKLKRQGNRIRLVGAVAEHAVVVCRHDGHELHPHARPPDREVVPAPVRVDRPVFVFVWVGGRGRGRAGVRRIVR